MVTRGIHKHFLMCIPPDTKYLRELYLIKKTLLNDINLVKINFFTIVFSCVFSFFCDPGKLKNEAGGHFDFFIMKKQIIKFFSRWDYWYILILFQSNCKQSNSWTDTDLNGTIYSQKEHEIFVKKKKMFFPKKLHKVSLGKTIFNPGIISCSNIHCIHESCVSITSMHKFCRG